CAQCARKRPTEMEGRNRSSGGPRLAVLEAFMMLRGIGRAAAVFFAVFLIAAPARADRTMQEELARLAKDVEKYLQGQNQDSVDVGPFTGPAECNVEPQLRQAFVQELERLRVTVTAKARF